MKQTVWKFGLISGGILALALLITQPFIEQIGFEAAEIIGYTTIIAAFLLIFFGIRSYRDNKAGKTVSFGRALIIGVLINVVASACYTATWQLVYYKIAPDFNEKYAEYVIEKERKSGASQEEIAKKTADMKKFAEMYENPFINIAVTFMEPFAIGLIVSLLSAASLRRRGNGASVLADATSAGIGAVV